MISNIIIILAVIAAASVCVFTYIVQTSYEKKQEVSRNESKDYDGKDSMVLDREDDLDKQLEVDPDIEEDDTEPDEVEETLHQHGSDYYAAVESAKLNESYSAPVDNSSMLDLQWEEAESFLISDQFADLFNSGYYPEDWKFEVLDCIDYEDGRTVYLYWIPNTDVRVNIYKEKDSSEFTADECGNKYGSDYSDIKFLKGVPSNSQIIYEQLLSKNYPYGCYTTDYKEGDTSISLYSAMDCYETFEDISLID